MSRQLLDPYRALAENDALVRAGGIPVLVEEIEVDHNFTRIRVWNFEYG
jgi:hypothetical protein